MSIGGDIVSEAIALLQPVKGVFNVNIREYCGELDDMAKDGFRLPSYLYLAQPDAASTGTDYNEDNQMSTILVEYNGVDHEPRDGHNLLYINTYRMNVWIVAGYALTTAHKQGGEHLEQEVGYHLYDAVLDLIAARKILKNAETVRLVRGERVYFGNLDDDGQAATIYPMAANEHHATVYKLEFTVKAQSVWEEFGSSVGASPLAKLLTRDGSETGETTEENTGRITAEGEPWYLAGGDILESSSNFLVQPEFTINDAYVDFNERSTQYMPNDRISWKGSFSHIQLPTAIFPMIEAGPTKTDVVAALTDVVDGYTLHGNVSSSLYRRIAAGLYGTDFLGRIKYSPIRGVETTGNDVGFTAVMRDGEEASAADVLDPYDKERETLHSFSGFVVVRFDNSSSGVIMGKKTVSGDHIGNGWNLSVDSDLKISLEVKYLDATNSQVAKTLTISDPAEPGEWVGILFSAKELDSAKPELSLYTSKGNQSDSILDSWASWGIEATNPQLSLNGTFTLADAKGHYAYAAYWQGPEKYYAVASDDAFRYLWRGTTLQVNNWKEPGMITSLGGSMVWPVTQSISSGNTVSTFGIYEPGDDPVKTPIDIYTVLDRTQRVLPHDKVRVNLLPYSAALHNWTGGAGLDPCNGPDGLSSGTVLSTTQSLSVPSPTLNLPDGSYIFSVWARCETDSSAVLDLEITTGNSESIPLNSTWKRVHIKETFDSGAGSASVPRIVHNSGADIHIWGPQLESSDLVFDPLDTSSGSLPSAYIPTNSDVQSPATGVEDCYVDWTVLPAPRAKSGKVQAKLIVNRDMLLTGNFHAFHILEDHENENSDNNLLLTADIAEDSGTYVLTWELSGKLLDSSQSQASVSLTASESMIIEEGQTLTVAVRWCAGRLELWAEDEMVGLTSGWEFSEDPNRCHLMRSVVWSTDHWTPVESGKWIGACKEVRWWK